MTNLTIEQIKNMFAVGTQFISNEYEYINELNVFPVPDGDTGSNLKITTEGAISTIKDMQFNDLQTLGKAFSRALLMNARGNSGVIFSQIIKGFVSVFTEKSTKLSIDQFIDALCKAKEMAYRSVSTPVEGTILTVIRVTSENIAKKRSSYKTMEALVKDIVKESNEILKKTPEFLIELKNAGVVDSGGYGLVCFFKGIEESLTNKKTNEKQTVKQTPKKEISTVPGFVDNNDGFGYCCEFILKLGAKVVLEQKNKENFNLKNLKEELMAIGDSLVAVNDEDILKVHVHSINPYKVLQIGQKYGEFSKVKVENMTFQFLERNPGMTLGSSSSTKKITLSNKPAIIITSPTGLLSKTFKNDLAVNYVIECEKNGNPSIQEFLDALNSTKSSKVILLVDDGNMVLAAKEAISLFKNVNKSASITLINTGDIATTYALCLAYNPESEYKNNIKILTKQCKGLAAGKISKSIKKVEYSHINIKKNDYIGIISKKIISSSTNINKVIEQTFSLLNKQQKHSKHAYVFYGSNVNPATLSVIEKEWMEKYGMEVTLIPTNETIYYFHIVLK